MSETKIETFQRLFPPRAAKVLDTIRVAGHCMKPHMEADTGLTDQFVRDVREAMDVFPSLGTDTLVASIPGVSDDEVDYMATNEFEADDEPDTVTIRKSEFDRLKALELDRAKVAYGLSKIEKTLVGENISVEKEPGITLIKEGIGRKVKNDDDSEHE